MVSAVVLLLALAVSVAPRNVYGEDEAGYTRQVQQMYLAYYGRPGDPGGVTYWAGRLADEGGNWIDDLVNAFGTSEEYTTRFGALSQEDLITNLYQQMFNRSTDPIGLAFYLDLLNGTNSTGFNAGGRRSTLAQLALDISNGAIGADRERIDNKLRISDFFTERVAAAETPYDGGNIDEAIAILAEVTEAEESVAIGQQKVGTFVRLSGFAMAPVSLSGEEVVLIGAGPGYGPEGAALTLSGGSPANVVSADLSPDGETVWVLSYDINDSVDGGWAFYIMDRSGSNVVRKPLPDMGSYVNQPEVAIADAYGAFGFLSVPISAGGSRHWRVYSTTWHDDTGLTEKLDTYQVTQIDAEFPRGRFVNYAPLALRAVTGVEGFHFLNGPGVYVGNESSPGQPIRTGWTQDLRWNGDPPAASTNWSGLDIGGGRWLSSLQLAPGKRAVIGGELVGTVFNLQFVTDSSADEIRQTDISDSGSIVSYCVGQGFTTDCYAGEYGGTANRIVPANPNWQTRWAGLSGAGNRLWAEESNFIGSQWTYVADLDGSNAHRAGARLESYESPLLDEDGDTLLVRSRYSSGFTSRLGLSLVSYRPGLLSGATPQLRDFRFRVSASLVELDVEASDNVTAVRAQAFKAGYGVERWFPGNGIYSGVFSGSGVWLTRGDDGHFTAAVGLYGEPGAGDIVRLTAFDASGTYTSFVDAPLAVTH